MIKIRSVEVLDNPCNFLQPFQFKITFKADADLKDNEYEWKIVYVGSPESSEFDQILLSKSLGSYSKGQHDLILCSAPVDPDKIPKEELLEPSAVLLVGYYNHKQFFQVGYLVSKEYLDDAEPEDAKIEYDKLQRRIPNFSRIISDDNTAEGSDNTGDFVHDSIRSIQSENLDIFCDLIQKTDVIPRIISDDNTAVGRDNTSDFVRDSIRSIQSENLDKFCDLTEKMDVIPSIISDDNTAEGRDNTSEFVSDSIRSIQSENLDKFCDLTQKMDIIPH